MNEINATPIPNGNFQQNNHPVFRKKHIKADAKWRANLTSCYETLKSLTFVDRYKDKLFKKHNTKALTLRCTQKHIIFLENLLQTLLDEKVECNKEGTLAFPPDCTIACYQNRFAKFLEKEKMRRNLKRKEMREAKNKYKKLMWITPSKIAALSEMMNKTSNDEMPLKMHNLFNLSQQFTGPKKNKSSKNIFRNFMNKSTSSHCQTFLSLPHHFRKQITTHLSSSPVAQEVPQKHEKTKKKEYLKQKKNQECKHKSCTSNLRVTKRNHKRAKLSTTKAMYVTSTIEANDLSSFNDMSLIQADVRQAPYTPCIHHFTPEISYMYETEIPDQKTSSFVKTEHLFQSTSVSSFSSPILQRSFNENSDSQGGMWLNSFNNWVFDDPEEIDSRPLYQQDTRKVWNNTNRKLKFLKGSRIARKKQRGLKCKRKLEESFSKHPSTGNPSEFKFDGYLLFYKETIARLEEFIPAEDINTKAMSKSISQMWHGLTEDEQETYIAMAMVEASHTESLSRLSDDLQDVCVVPISDISLNDSASDNALVPLFCENNSTSIQDTGMGNDMFSDHTSVMPQSPKKTEDSQEIIFELPQLDFSLMNEVNLSFLEREHNISVSSLDPEASGNSYSLDNFQMLQLENLEFIENNEIEFFEERSDVQLVPSWNITHLQPYSEAAEWQVVPECDIMRDFEDTSLE